MPSPFPGMNPFLEQDGLWVDFHTKYLAALNEALVAQVRPRYIVLVEQYRYVQGPEERRLIGRVDVSIVPAAPAAGEVAGGLAVLDAPAEVEWDELPVEPMPYLEILDRKDRHLVAVIELLSPSNKRGRDRDQYLAKREAVLRSDAHLVEIDLLRGGSALPPVRPHSTYSVLVSRAGQRPRAGLWPIGLRDRLPVVPVPLMAPDPDARLDLQAALDRVYDAYGYEDFLYDNQPDPPMTPFEEAWAREILPRIGG
ncbi:MAG: DUF4058 family protein [Isosphaeraceae bacterium]